MSGHEVGQPRFLDRLRAIVLAERARVGRMNGTAQDVIETFAVGRKP